MLSAADADLADRQEALLGLQMVLDPAALLELANRSFPGAEFESASITHVRFRPGRRCLVGFRAEGPGKHGDGYAVAHRAGEKAIVVRFFPEDPVLHSLRDLAEEEGRERLLREVVPLRKDLFNADLRTELYRPERRYTGALTVRGKPRALVKAFERADFRRAARAMRALGGEPTLRVPRLIGESEAESLLVCEWLPGLHLQDVLVAGDAREAATAAAAAGRALRALHSSHVAGLRRRPPKTISSRTIDAAEEVACLCPPIARRALSLAQKLARATAPGAAVPTHGDYKALHCIMRGNSVGMVDLDNAARGEPAEDLGNFVAHLELDAERGVLPRRKARAAIGAFLAAYGTHDVEPFRRALAAALVRRARDPFRKRDPDWPRAAKALVAKAEQVADGRGSWEG